MEYYIETGLSGRKRYKLHEITPYNLPNLKNQPLNKDWIPFAIKIMDDLAVDFNSYKFFCDVLKNTPSRFGADTGNAERTYNETAERSNAADS